MCGIVGFWCLKPEKVREGLEYIAGQMSKTQVHRGPDDSGVWSDSGAGIALAHRRLAIIDLNETGRQPMASPSGRLVMVYNGEIYNFLELKKELEESGVKFKGNSDTEVLLAAIEEWGLEKTLTRCNGMFAFAVWDKQEHVLHLARDRIGKKPLYYGWLGDVFVFSSELKALHKHPRFEPRVDRNALAVYCRHNYVPCPWSIFENIYKLPPASFVSLSVKDGFSAYDKGKPLKTENYWDIREQAEKGVKNPLIRTEKEYIEELDGVLSAAVSQRMISDVPLGAFLSGGIDSSLVVALMQKQATRPVKTFSIGFEEQQFNEAQYAKDVAAHLGTDHTEFHVTAKEARDVIPLMPFIFDEPFADASQIPTYHVCRLAKEHVTVALSGDGGDEGFAGYARYGKGQKLDRFLNGPLGVFAPGAGKILGGIFSDDRYEKLSRLLQAKNTQDWYRAAMSYWQEPESLVIGAKEYPTTMTNFAGFAGNDDPVNYMMLADMCTYLPDDILVKVDRTSMAVSLEARAPLLDYHVLEYAWQLPMLVKQRNGQRGYEGKYILKQVLGRYVPPALFERPKQGFGIPLASWLRGPLREWAEDLLDEDRLRQEGYFHPEPIRKKWQEHLSGSRNWDSCLWGILMFQAWQKEWMHK